MTVQISVRLPDEDVARIDELVRAGDHATRTAFVTSAVASALALDREQRTAEQYRRAYTEHPFPSTDEQWVTDASRRALLGLERP
jgi:Arc/MetJ-type ribon-helix-helix transcriptional regulator